MAYQLPDDLEPVNKIPDDLEIVEPNKTSFLRALAQRGVEGAKAALGPVLNPKGMAGQAYEALEGPAMAGRAINKKIEQAADIMAEKGGIPGAIVGTAAYTAGKLIIPEDKLGVALTAAGGLKALKGLKSTKAIARSVPEINKVVKPNAAQDVLGSVITATTAIPQRYASAVLADPSILKGPSMEDVGKLYQEAFKKAGMKIDSDLYKEISGSRFPPSDSEIGKLKSIVENALNNLENGTLKENDAFVARSAAAALERSNQAMMNGRFKQVASGAKDSFDNFLENSTLPNIRDLSRRYFKAVAKEHFEPLLPRNKNMSVNALRSVIALKQVAESVGNLATGNIPGAIGSAVKGAAMSPFIVGQGITSSSKAVKNIPQAMRAAPLLYNSIATMMSPKGEQTDVPGSEVPDLLKQGYQIKALKRSP